MDGVDVHHDHIRPNASAASAVAALLVCECDRDQPLVSIPRPEVQLVVRFGAAARGALDAHAFGARQRAHRKLIRTGQRSATARLRLGATEAVLGVPASDMAGRIVALEDLWGDGATQQLLDRLGAAHSTVDAAGVLESAIAERVARVGPRPAPSDLALQAAERLAYASVSVVASSLGVSERHLRRVFRETVGMSPKAFAKLARFHRALGAAREDDPESWASIAVTNGYYDQAHMIDEFRAIAGVTPRALLGELVATTGLSFRSVVGATSRAAGGLPDPGPVPRRLVGRLA